MPGENISHFHAVRLRVVGAGDLKLQFQPLIGGTNQDLVPITMSATTDREPTRLSNFKTQRAYLKIYTTEQNEVFRIQKVIVFARPLFTSYPQ